MAEQMVERSAIQEAKVKAVMVDTRDNSCVVVLRDRHSSKATPFRIGQAEAMSIALELQRHSFPRPLPHELMERLPAALGGTVGQVVISNLEKGIYYATLHVRTVHGKPKETDVRPTW